MATSGSFTTSGYQGRCLQFSWSRTSYSVANNTSTISYTLKGYGTATSTWYKAGNFKLVVNGTTVYETASSDRIKLYNGTVLKTGTMTISHNDDGTKSFSASAKAGIYTYAQNCSGSGSWSLSTIPRKATIDSAPDFTDEDNPKITYTNSAGSSVSTLMACISFDGSNDDIEYRNISKSGTSYTFDLTDSERNVLRNACKNAKSMDVIFYVRTVIGDNTYYSTLTKKLTITNASPTLSPSIKDVDSTTYALTGDSSKFIKGYSDAQFSFGDSAKKGASIKSRKITCGSKSSTSSSGTLSNVESGTFVFSTTDTRGYTTTKTLTKTLINYVPITCVLNAKSPNAEGEMSFNISGNYFASSFGKVSNSLTLKYRYKENDGSYGNWTTVTPSINTSKNTYSITVKITELNYKSKYTFQAYAVDELKSVYSAEQTVKTTPVFDWSNDDFNFNVPVTFGADGNITSTQLRQLILCMGNSYYPECTVTLGSNYTSGSASCYLVGNCARFYMTAVRSSSASVGDIANETVMTINVNHGGKMGALFNTGFSNATTGAPAHFCTTNEAVDDDNMAVIVNMTGTAVADDAWNAYWVMPFRPVLSAYT